MTSSAITLRLGGPLLREREGVKLTQRSLSNRLAEVVDRLASVCEASMPQLNETEWSLVSWAGWDAIQNTRILHGRSEPETVDHHAWTMLVIEAAEREKEVPGLARKLTAMTIPERVAVLERIEAYGRAEAMRHA